MNSGDGIRLTTVLAAVAVQGQRGHREDVLEGHHEPGPTGRQHGQARAAGQQPLDERRHAVAEVLAVVQHQQGVAIGQGGHHRVGEAAALLLPDAERRPRRRLPPSPDR